MNRFIFIFLIAILPITCFSQNTPKVTLVDELEPLYPDEIIKIEESETTIHVAQNAVAAVHLFIRDLPANEVLHITRGDSSKFPRANVFKLIDVPVEINTGIESRTEKWDDKQNPYVIRRAPFRIYEALQPVELPLFTDKSVVAFRLQWTIGSNIKPGAYHLRLQLSGTELDRQLLIKIIVYNAKVPAVSKDSYGYTNWFSLKQIAKRHHLEQWSESFWIMLQSYADLMLYARQNTFWVPIKDFVDLENGEPVLQRKRLEEYIRLFRKTGLYYIEFSPFTRRTNGDWSSHTISSSIRPHLLATSDEGKIFHKKLFHQLSELIQDNGWQNSCRFHIADEPTDELVDDYITFANLLKKSIPGIPVMEATMTQGLSGTVDIWTPQLHEFQQHQKFFEQQKKKGSAVWVYSCLVPGGPWLNRLLDQERLRPLYLGWSLPYYDLAGFLHWGLNHYNTNNPLNQSVVDHPQAPGTNNQLPAGDTHLIYPGTKGPWSSLRLEAQRIGMEDAELLKMIKKENPSGMKQITKKIFRAFDDYDKSVTRYREVKQELLELALNN